MFLPVIFSESFDFCLLIISTSTFHCSLVKPAISSFLSSLLAWLLLPIACATFARAKFPLFLIPWRPLPFHFPSLFGLSPHHSGYPTSWKHPFILWPFFTAMSARHYFFYSVSAPFFFVIGLHRETHNQPSHSFFLYQHCVYTI